MGVWTSNDSPLLEPVLADGTQQSLEPQEVKRVEDVVNDALELIGVVGVDDLVLAVRRLDGKLVGYVRLPASVDGAHSRGETSVVEVLNVWVSDGDFPLLQELDYT